MATEGTFVNSAPVVYQQQVAAAPQPRIVYVQQQAPPVNAYAQGQQPVIIMQQQPAVQQPRVVYVQQSAPMGSTNYIQGQPMPMQMQPMQMVQQPARYVPQYQQTPIDCELFLKRKLSERTQMCCCCNCCPLFGGTMAWLIVFLVYNSISALVYFIPIMFGYYRLITVANFVVCAFQAIVNCFALLGLHRCVPGYIFAQIIFAVMGVIQSICIMAWHDSGFMYFLMFVFIFMYVYASVIWYRVYKWADYYKMGGYHDANMNRPLEFSKQ